MPTLIVQMGHCYRTTGATGTTGEQQYATDVAKACQVQLHGRGGWSVKSILADEGAASYRGDAFVAIHCDGSLNTSARGASIGYQSAAGQAFGQAWKRAYASRGWTGGFRGDNYTAALAQYYGVRNAINVGNSRAFIAECGFLTSPADRALLTGPGGPDRVALAIGDALGIPVGDMVADTETIMDIAYRLRDLLTKNAIQTGGPNKGYELPMVRDLDAANWRVDAIINNLAAVRGGPTGPREGGTPERNELASALAELNEKLDDVLARLPEAPPES